jgi:hypothetical protein
LQVTFERLFNILLDSPDHSGLLHLEEAQQFFETLDCYKKGHADRITALKLKGGSSWYRETVNENDKRSCPYTHVIVTDFTQPEPIAREIEKTPNDGLLYRWNFSFCPLEYPTFGKRKQKARHLTFCASCIHNLSCTPSSHSAQELQLQSASDIRGLISSMDLDPTESKRSPARRLPI